MRAGHRERLEQPDAGRILDDRLEGAARVRLGARELVARRRAVEQRVHARVGVGGEVRTTLHDPGRRPALLEPRHARVRRVCGHLGVEGARLLLGDIGAEIDLFDLHGHADAPERFLEQHRVCLARGARRRTHEREFELPAILGPYRPRSHHPPRRIEQLTRLDGVVGQLRQRAVGHGQGMRERTIGNLAERIEHIPEHGATIDRHAQRTPHRSFTEHRMWQRRVRRIPEVHRHVGVLQRGIAHRATQRICPDLLEMLGTVERLDEVGVARKEARHRRGVVRRHRVHDAVELRTTAIVGGVGEQLELLARRPFAKPEPSRPDAAAPDLGRLQLAGRGIAEDVLGDDQDLVHEVVELLGDPALEPRDRGQRVAHRNRVDVRDHRSRRRAERGVLGDRHAVTHVAGAHWLTVVPPRPGAQVKHDRQRIGCPLPPLRQLGTEPLVAHRDHLRSQLGQAIVEHVGDLPVDARSGEWCQQRRGIGRAGDHHRAPRFGWLGRRRRLRARAAGQRESGHGERRPAADTDESECGHVGRGGDGWMEQRVNDGSLS